MLEQVAHGDLAEARGGRASVGPRVAEDALHGRAQCEPAVLDEAVGGERDDELAHARLAEERRRLHRRIARLGERVPARVHEPSALDERESGAADAVAAHRLPHRVVDGGDGDGPRRCEPGRPHPVGARGEERGESCASARSTGLHDDRHQTLRDQGVELALVARAGHVVPRDPARRRIVAEDRGVAAVRGDADVSRPAACRRKCVEARLMARGGVRESLHRPADQVGIVHPDPRIARVGAAAVDGKAHRVPPVLAGLVDAEVDGVWIGDRAPAEAEAREGDCPGGLDEGPGEDGVVRGARGREQLRDVSGGDIRIERGLVAGGVEPVNRRPARAGRVDPDRRVALVTARAVDAEADHPPALRIEVVELRLVIGARPIVIRDPSQATAHGA